MGEKSNIVKFIRLFLGAVFILSAVAKIYSMNFFDDLVAGQLLGKGYLNDANNYDKFYWVQWLTRIIIAGEFMLGVAVLQEKHLKKIVLPAMIGVLVLFTLQIIYAASFQGKGYIGGNCGCFGDVIPFDNMETIIKNIVLTGLTLAVIKWYKVGESMNIPPVVIPYTVGAVTLFTLFLTIKTIEPVASIEPMDFDAFAVPEKAVEKEIDSSTVEKVEVDSIKARMDSLINIANKKDADAGVKLPEPKLPTKVVTKKASIFDAYTKFSNGEVKDLEEGTHLICMFSYSCGHCQQTYREILELKKSGGNFGGLYIIGYGSDFDKQAFWNQAGGIVAPHITIDDYPEFGKLLNGSDFPKVIVKKNGATKKIWDIDTYSKSSLFDYFGIKTEDKRTVPEPEGILTPKVETPTIELEDPFGTTKQPWE